MACQKAFGTGRTRLRNDSSFQLNKELQQLTNTECRELAAFQLSPSLLHFPTPSCSQRGWGKNTGEGDGIWQGVTSPCPAVHMAGEIAGGGCLDLGARACCELARGQAGPEGAQASSRRSRLRGWGVQMATKPSNLMIKLKSLSGCLSRRRRVLRQLGRPGWGSVTLTARAGALG